MRLHGTTQILLWHRSARKKNERLHHPRVAEFLIAEWKPR